MVRADFYDPISGLDGTQYNATLSYAIGDLASITVITSGLSGIGLNATVSEVRFSADDAVKYSSRNSQWISCTQCGKPTSVSRIPGILQR